MPPRHFAARTLLLLVYVSAISPFAHAQTGVTTDLKKAAAEPPSTITRRIEKEGVAIEFSLTTPPGSTGRLVAGADAVATFRMTDARPGRPLTGVRPNAWLIALKPGEPTPDEAQCRERLRTLMSGSLSANTAIDLNRYLLLTLNHDNTVAFINPQVSFATTKLESLVTLPGRGADWALTSDGNLLLVSVASRGVAFRDLPFIEVNVAEGSQE